jgi:lipoyl(octanoyl) transferase
LQTYLLGTVEFESALVLQRRWVYDVAGGAAPFLMLCEHPPILTVGRQGSHAHFFLEHLDFFNDRFRVRWVNRGGGCWLQMPGQLAIYAILPLERLALSLGHYFRAVQRALVAVLDDFSIRAHVYGGSPDVWVGGRPIACLGAAVRNWVSYYGAVLNVSCDLEPFRWVRTGRGHPPMTSLARERRGLVSPSLVRQRFIEHFAAAFGFSETLFFSHHPQLVRKAAADALAATR